MTTQAHKQQTQQDELVGRVINDRFRIISVIARGGMGRVYRAEQLPLGRLVAVKTLDPRNNGGENDPQFQQRFFLEASIASKLQHPNTVTVFDYGRTVDGIYFIAMELVEGRSLLNLVRQEAPLTPERVIHISMQIARSLREAHRLDVIHRDLKPGNVLLTRHGDEEDFVKVLDFGLVKHIEPEPEQELTKAGLFMGSPKYMSPEQIRGERVDARADIYALGVVMYEMLTGKVPFERENTVKVLMAHMHEPVPPLGADDCPEPLAQLVMRCLEKRPEQRPGSLDEVIVGLKQASGAGQLTTSGAFALSQEIRLAGAPHATPAHGFTYGPSSGARALGGDGMVSIGTLPPGGTIPPGMLSTGGTLPPGAMSLHPPSHTLSGVIPYAPQPTLAPPYMATMAPATQMHASPLPKVALAAAVVIAAGFFGLTLAGRSESIAAQNANAPALAGATSSNQTAIAESLPTSAPTVESIRSTQAPHVMVRLTSTPSGAKVTADGKAYGQTPADIEWWNEGAAEGRQIVFTFEKDGFDKVTVVRTVHGEKLNVEAILPLKAGLRRRHASADNGPKAPVVVPNNFKEDPY